METFRLNLCVDFPLDKVDTVGLFAHLNQLKEELGVTYVWNAAVGVKPVVDDDTICGIRLSVLKRLEQDVLLELKNFWMHGDSHTYDQKLHSVIEIAKQLQAGKFITAIKEFRYCTNAGLKEAKEACDRVRNEHNLKF